MIVLYKITNYFKTKILYHNCRLWVNNDVEKGNAALSDRVSNLGESDTIAFCLTFNVIGWKIIKAWHHRSDVVA